jgi:hypothetical protein
MVVVVVLLTNVIQLHLKVVGKSEITYLFINPLANIVHSYETAPLISTEIGIERRIVSVLIGQMYP